MIRIISFKGLIIGLFAWLAPAIPSVAEDTRPHSVLVLDQSDLRGPFYCQLWATRNVALYLQAAPGALRVRGDPVQLQQVVLNLVVNSMDALAAIPYGRTVIGRTELNGGELVMISISDSGPGIPPDKLAQVFDPFFTTKDQGMGIGLSIARTIILAHKGQIWAENQSGGGAAFHFTLPLAA